MASGSAAVLFLFAATQTPVDLGPTTTPTTAAPHDAFEYAPYAALIDGGWSFVMTIGWILSARSLDEPLPEGLLGLAAARILYGTTWTVQFGINTALLQLIAGETFEGLEGGTLRNHWLVGASVPAPCERGGAFCGFGLGAYSEIAVSLGDGLELAMTGGWIQGRFDTDERRALVESTWVQAPAIARTRQRVEFGPVAVEVVLGGGVYYGMHNAHVHERPAFRGTLDVPPWEIVVLHAGAGIGAHAKLAIDLFDVLTLEAEADVAPFLVAIRPDRPAVVAPLDADTDGTIVWRRAAVGIGLARDVFPVRLAVRVFGLELGSGPVGRFGHRGLALQFDTPLRDRA